MDMSRLDDLLQQNLHTYETIEYYNVRKSGERGRFHFFRKMDHVEYVREGEQTTVGNYIGAVFILSSAPRKLLWFNL